MTLRRTLTGLALCVMALTLLMGCVESGPPPPPDGGDAAAAALPALLCYRFQPGPSGRPFHRPARSGPYSSTMKLRSWNPPGAGPGWWTCAAISSAGPPCATCNRPRLTGRGRCPGAGRRCQGAGPARPHPQSHVGEVLSGKYWERNLPGMVAPEGYASGLAWTTRRCERIPRQTNEPGRDELRPCLCAYTESQSQRAELPGRTCGCALNQGRTPKVRPYRKIAICL